MDVWIVAQLILEEVNVFDNSTLRSRAAWAMNSYYHGLGRGNDATCNFWGTAAIVDLDPSYGSCNYQS
ncbi:hypothetical protein P3L10_016506 [Capsicum annuum]